MQVDRYLARIGYSREPRVDLRTLFGLQRAHLASVPFENLDIHRGRRIVLDPAALHDKIVERRRGGFCYEVNGLYAELLESIGFTVDRLAAQVHSPERGWGSAFAHLALRVRCRTGSYLVDVGFGDSFVRPLRLDRRRPVREGPVRYEILPSQDGLELRRTRAGGSASEPMYRFGLEPHDLAAFAPMCEFQQSSPDSHFTRNTICTRTTPTGRLTLRGDRLIETRGAERIESLLETPEAIDQALARHFGILL